MRSCPDASPAGQRWRPRDKSWFKSSSSYLNFFTQLPYATRWHLVAIVLLVCSLMSRSLLPEKFTVATVTEMYAILFKTLASIQKAKSLPPVTSVPFPEAWDVPSTSQELFDSNTRIIWGYWDSGVEGMPELCQKALLSWQIRNPNWTIQFLDDTNFQQFVSMSDLPSTFHSLKVQHRSDLIRLAVLIRYGGIYLDASTLVYKSFDHLWDTVADDKLMLTSLNHLEDTGVDMFNNGLLMTRGTHNPVLIEWRRRIIQYSENPALTLEAMHEHPSFARVKHHWNDRSLGLLADMIPYHSNLWILNDMIWHNDLELAQHVVHLPKLRWGFYFLTFPFLFTQLKSLHAEQLYDPSQDPLVVPWTLYSLFQSAVSHFLTAFTDDVELARGTMDHMHVLKFTSHDMELVHFCVTRLGLQNTLGRIYRAAFTLEEYPLYSATLNGAVPPLLMTTTSVMEEEDEDKHSSNDQHSATTNNPIAAGNDSPQQPLSTSASEQPTLDSSSQRRSSRTQPISSSEPASTGNNDTTGCVQPDAPSAQSCLVDM